MAATPNPSRDFTVAPAQSNPPLPEDSLRPQTQTVPNPAAIVSPLHQEEAVLRPENWAFAGHGSKWPSLRKELLHAKTALEQMFRPESSGSHQSRISPVVRRELLPSRMLLYTAVGTAERALRPKTKVPQVLESGQMVPRVYLIAKNYLSRVSWKFDQDSFLRYAQASQAAHPLEIAEIWLLSPMLQLCVILKLSTELDKNLRELGPEIREYLLAYCATLASIHQQDWANTFSTLSVTENVLSTDPAGAYAAMEFESRDSYREAIQDLARYSQPEEDEIARMAIALAQEAVNGQHPFSRETIRFTHVGFYLVASGRRVLEKRIGYRPAGMALIRKLWLEAPEFYYLLAVQFAIFSVMVFLFSATPSGIPLVAASLLLLLPCSQAALETINQVVRILLPPRTIPRLDFQKGIPEEYATVVAVPALLLSAPQVEHLVRVLEIRYLGNTDDNLYFALLTDPPDSATAFDEKDELASLCSDLIRNLNRKYAASGPDRFFHLHRNRTFNETENTWMGWERKRGKLLDLNELILGREDKFPVKAGDVTRLRRVKYVITLDADTQLPRGVAARLVGAMAHPLNRAVVDPLTRTVRAGYGVLQPRIGISVQSVNRSRLAYIYSGQTGLDIYTHAVSDVYQDLFGEAIFTGKGIYEVDVFHEVLWDRFPSNAILSHDLIEGVFARTGLVSELELVDDYPSHFSAYSRRKHRWIRGDWQILKWLFPRVPNAERQRVVNPLNAVSRWKILDNLRRSVIEAATFILLLASWFFLPGSPAVWTIATVAMLLIPVYAQALLTTIRQYDALHPGASLLQAVSDFATAQVDVLVFLAFLPHQTLVTLDAIARTLFRLTITHQKLLEWETAAQSELDQRKEAPADRYLKLIPLLTLVIALGVFFFRPDSFAAAAPILVLWLVASPAVKWLDRPLRASGALSASDQTFLRQIALKTWRFFSQYSIPEENWLIPDNVQGQENQIAHRLSTTNLGLLFNSQLAAVRLGMLTLPQFAARASRTMSSVKRLPRFHGHLANWHDTQSLQPLEPVFISSVDNGNLACCLWTLKQGASDLLDAPLFPLAFFQSTLDMLDILLEAMNQEAYDREALEMVRTVRAGAAALQSDVKLWCAAAPSLLQQLTSIRNASCDPGKNDARWWLDDVCLHIRSMLEMARNFAPWFLPQFASALEELAPSLPNTGFVRPTLHSLPENYSKISDAKGGPELCRLQAAVADSARNVRESRSALLELAADAERLVQEMDFRLFYDDARHAISVGYSVAESERLKACYDLLASEARSALFIGIAKNELPGEAWFRLGRLHTHYAGQDVLVSWTGTMFEYLMPALWLRHFPNTLVENSLQGVIDCQRTFSASYGIPWGISEGACPPKLTGAVYDYQAFGLPQLALRGDASGRIIITPYAGALALNVDLPAALQNLRDMADRGWVGKFGFYESVEYWRPSEARAAGSFEIVHAWMAHHQGMILVSICNALDSWVFSDLFHRDVRVEATERLLHELPLSATARQIARTGLQFGIDSH